MTLTPSTRASLLLRLRDPQDHEAWVEFVAICAPVTYRLLRQNGLQDADAREIMQELFLAVSRSIDRWDPSKERGSFRGWLRRVARNLVINWLKQRERHVKAVGGTDLQAMLDRVPAAEGPESSEFDRELRRALFQRAAERVRGDVHSTTWKAFWETSVVGTPPAEAAKKLGMTPGAIRVAKCRVLARLRAGWILFGISFRPAAAEGSRPGAAAGTASRRQPKGHMPLVAVPRQRQRGVAARFPRGRRQPERQRRGRRRLHPVALLVGVPRGEAVDRDHAAVQGEHQCPRRLVRLHAADVGRRAAPSGHGAVSPRPRRRHRAPGRPALDDAAFLGQAP
jgi:RNA polymerase sigma factor (sigma-70 family)